MIVNSGGEILVKRGQKFRMYFLQLPSQISLQTAQSA